MFQLSLVRVTAFITLLFSCAIFSAQTASDQFALTHVAVIDTRDGAVHENMTVLISNGVISSVLLPNKTRIPKGTREIDATGKFLIPGLWDMHVHIAQDDKIQWTRTTVIPLLIANGITGVRDMGGNIELIEQLRAEIEAKKLVGPRIFAAGPQIIGTGSEKIWPLSDWPAEGFARVGTKSESELLIQGLKARGVDFVKVQSQGPPIPREAYFAIAETSRRLGLTYVGHVPDTIGADEVSNAGQKSIEHLSGIFLACSSNEAELRKQTVEADLDPANFHTFAVRGSFDLPARGVFESYSAEKAAKLFALFAKNHTWQVPTLTIKQSNALAAKGEFFNDPRLALIPEEFRKNVMGPPAYFKRMDAHESADLPLALEKSLAAVAAMKKAGVEFMTGTDIPYPPLIGSGVHDEMALFVRAGMTPLEALQAATLNPAKFLGKTDQYGTVEAGKVADLVLLDGNPLVDVENVRRVRAVVVAGRFLGREELDGLMRDRPASGLGK